MANIANSVGSVAITNTTVSNAVGICYFDPLTEALLEINDIPNHYLAVEPTQQVIRKYYIVVAPNETISYVKVKIANKDDLVDNYSVKLVISSDAPTSDAFTGLPDFNSFRMLNPSAGNFIPLWVLISSKTPINEISDIDLELEYE